MNWGVGGMAKSGFGLLVLVLVLVTLVRADADRMRPTQPGDVVSSLQDPKYKIDFHPPQSPVLPTSDQESIVMTDRDGKKFRCNIPVPESTKTENKDEGLQNVTSTSLVADERSSRKTPEDLLDALKDKCFRRYEGWWIYELCYMDQLRQFHLHDKKAPISTYGPDLQHGSVVYFFTLVKQPSNTPDSRNHRKRIVQEFVLGKYDAEATAALHENSPNVSLQKDPRSQSAAQRYHAHVYTNGTICDLTNQPRQTEVRFVCSETGRALINSIKEAPTCKYTVVFHAPMLCKHPAFQEERQPWVVIDCNAVPTDVVYVEGETTSTELAGHTVDQVGVDNHDGSATPALPESETTLLPLPEDDPSSLPGASTISEDERIILEVPSEFLDDGESSEKVNVYSVEKEKDGKLATHSDGGEKIGELAASTNGEEKVEESVPVAEGKENVEELAQSTDHIQKDPIT